MRRRAGGPVFEVRSGEGRETDPELPSFLNTG
jgi:hypothetical protein